MARRKRKQFTIDGDICYALETLARDSDEDLNVLADQAFRDLLKKRNRPITVEDALRKSLSAIPANDREPVAGGSKPTKRKPKRSR